MPNDDGHPAAGDERSVFFLPWPTAVLGQYGNFFTAWVIYALAMTATGLATTALWIYGSGDRGPADGVTSDLRRYYTARALIQPAGFLVSIPVALGLLNRVFRERVATRGVAS